jgi:hypothetical protein
MGNPQVRDIRALGQRPGIVLPQKNPILVFRVRWNQMTQPERRRLMDDYEKAQSDDVVAQGITITPKMRESIMKGQTAFKRGGSVSPEQAELQRRMQSILRPDSDDPEMVQ